MEFIVLPHRDSKDVFILGGVDDVQAALDDSQVNLPSMICRTFYMPLPTSFNAAELRAV